MTKPKCSKLDCNKFLKLTDMKCRCSNTYCLSHRLPEQHNCSYNFKISKIEQNKLEEDMKCVNQKIIKI
jgi:predicted nucleic acid binding AN1-type Zn finger protein